MHDRVFIVFLIGIAIKQVSSVASYRVQLERVRHSDLIKEFLKTNLSASQVDLQL